MIAAIISISGLDRVADETYPLQKRYHFGLFFGFLFPSPGVG
jgi:hypothetical protein